MFQYLLEACKNHFENSIRDKLLLSINRRPQVTLIDLMQVAVFDQLTVSQSQRYNEGNFL